MSATRSWVCGRKDGACRRRRHSGCFGGEGEASVADSGIWTLNHMEEFGLSGPGSADV